MNNHNHNHNYNHNHNHNHNHNYNIKIPIKFKEQLVKRFNPDNFKLEGYYFKTNLPCPLCEEFNAIDIDDWFSCVGCPFFEEVSQDGYPACFIFLEYFFKEEFNCSNSVIFKSFKISVHKDYFEEYKKTIKEIERHIKWV